MVYKKYFSPLLSYFTVYLFLPLVFFVVYGIVDTVYFELSDYFPELFVSYNQVTEKEDYEILQNKIRVATVLISVFLSAFFTAIYNNSRYEETVRLTDGLFKIPEELPRYLGRTLPSDLVCAFLPAIPFLALSLINYSEKFFKYFAGYLRPHLFIIDATGIIPAYLLIVLSSFAARLAAAPLALRRHRSLWLASFVDS